MQEALQEAGLTERESRVYLSLLELGGTTAGPLIKSSGVPNSKIYEVLGSLQSKGMISWSIKGKIKYFRAEEPKKLLILLKEKERKVEELLPSLEEKRQLSGNRMSVELFEGARAVKTMFFDLIRGARRGENMLGFFSGKKSGTFEAEEFYNWICDLKTNPGLKRHLLIPLKKKEEFEAFLKEDVKKTIKMTLRYSNFPFPGDIAIFNDKVIIFDWKGSPSATLIKSKSIYEDYKYFFLSLWDNKK